MSAPFVSALGMVAPHAGLAAASGGEATAAHAPATGSTRETVRRVAQEFEGMLVRQMLAAAKIGGEKEGGYGGMAVDALANGISQAGGLGLTRQIEDALARAALANGGR